MQAATSTEAAAMPADQVQLWQTEIALYDRRLEGLKADLAALDAARPLLLALAIERRMAAAESLHQVEAETVAGIAASRAELLELLDGYGASRDDRRALLALIATLPQGPALVRADAAKKRWQAAIEALASLK